MNKMNRVIIVLIIIFLLMGITSKVFAIDPTKYQPTITDEDTNVLLKVGKIVGAAQAIGSIVSVIALIVIGVKYMLSSVEEKAANKETFIFYVIGAILVFGISNISQAIYNWATKI